MLRIFCKLKNGIRDNLWCENTKINVYGSTIDFHCMGMKFLKCQRCITTDAKFMHVMKIALQHTTQHTPTQTYNNCIQQTFRNITKCYTRWRVLEIDKFCDFIRVYALCIVDIYIYLSMDLSLSQQCNFPFQQYCFYFCSTHPLRSLLVWSSSSSNIAIFSSPI